MATPYAAFSRGALTSQGASGSSSFAEKLTFVVRGWTLTAPTNASPWKSPSTSSPQRLASSVARAFGGAFFSLPTSSTYK